MKQLEWVNVAKGIAIIAVVLSHTNHGLLDYNLFPLKSIVYGIWFVPLFFVLGGFFIKEEIPILSYSVLAVVFLEIPVK